MRLTISILFFFSSLALAAQPAVNPNTFHFSFDFFGTLPTMIEDDDRFKDRFSAGGGAHLLYHRSLMPYLSLETGAGIQYFGLRQRSWELSFACDAPPEFGGAGQRTYIDVESGVSSFTLPFALMVHLNGTGDGMYLKPGLRTQLRIGANTGGRLHECGADDGRDFAVGEAEVKSLTFFPGFGIGYQFEGDDRRTSFLEINLSASAGRLLDASEGIDAFRFQSDAGALFMGVSFGWQIGGKKKDRRPKKARSAPVPGYYSGQ